MNKKRETQAIGIINRFLKKYDFEGKAVRGDEGVKFSEYAKAGHPWMSLDGSGLYNHLNGYAASWVLHTEFNEVLNQAGFYYEQGYAWDLTVYETGVSK
jgi:hypothetical protein